MQPLTTDELTDLGDALLHATLLSRSDLIDAVISDLGFPLRDVEEEYERTVAALARLVELGQDLIGRRPIAGPGQQVALLLPFNMGPFALFVIGAIIAAGNRVKVRLSTRAPKLTDVLAQTLRRADLPWHVTLSSQGGQEFVQEAIGSRAVTALIAYGGEELGEQLRQQPLGTRIIFEGPGKDPMLVGAGADPAHVADLVRRAKFNRSGQACTATERLVLPTDADAVLEAVVEMVRELHASPTWDPAADVSSLISDRAAAGIEAQLREAEQLGASILVGGAVRGRFVEPTVVVDVPREAALWQDETFGPVLPVRREATTAAMVEVATEGRYGLHGIVTGLPEVVDELRGDPYAVPVPDLRFGRVGTVTVDRPPLSEPVDDIAPFGGWGISGWVRDADGTLRQGPRVLAREVTR